MPIYEYYCADCQVEFELTRPISRMDDPAPCKTCGKEGKRQLSYFTYKSTSINSANRTFNNSNSGNLPKPPLRTHNKDDADQGGDGTPGD